MRGDERADRYDDYDEPTSSQGLWAATLVVAAVVLSFLAGRFVIGERLRGPAPAPQAIVAPAPLAPAPPAPVPGTNPTVTIVGSSAAPAAPVIIDAPAAPASTAASLESGVTRAQANADPLAGGRPAADGPAPRASTTSSSRRTSESTKSTASEPTRTTRATADADSGESSGGSTTRTSGEIRGGYDRRQTNKPYKPGGASSSSTSSESSTSSKSGKSGEWRVQAGSYATREAAEAYQQQLSDKGHQSSVRSAEVDGTTFYRVIVSSHRDESRAREVAKQLKDDGLDVSIEQ